MSIAATTASPGIAAAWHGPGAPDRPRSFEWKILLWALVFPERRHRISVTVPGLFLMGLAMGIGTAAYNTASNILFITLSLLLACLLLSGLLSWFNFRGVAWRLRPQGPWRAGRETLVTAEIRNGKNWLPTYGLWLDFLARPKFPAPAAGGSEPRVRDVLKAFEQSVTRHRLFLRERLEAGGDASLEWNHRPARRGEAVVELEAVGSFFPFGFLRKSIGAGQRHTVRVWPAQVDYKWRGAAAALAGSQGRRTSRAGAGDDLLALRSYNQGDSHRLIHWKASARLGRLMIRQFAAESHDGYLLRVDTPPGVWARPEQFELLCSFAGTLAEDLFAEGRLQGACINGGPVLDTRRMGGVEAFLDELAVLQPDSAGGRPSSPAAVPASRNLITFAPEGARGVTAHVDGIPTASA